MRRAPLMAVAAIAILSVMTSLALFMSADATCPPGVTPLVPNVFWEFTDSLSACAAGDSLVFSHSSSHKHPSVLRFKIVYQDANCDPIVGVPPESIWVTTSTYTGTVKVNDQPGKIFANDSTNGSGLTRFTITSLSGSGKLRVNLFIRGSSAGVKTITIRTVDTNADERVTSSDQTGAQDLNYNGTVGDTTDVRLVQNHLDHWKRNALHGALVRRTNLCESSSQPDTCTPRVGESGGYWSPSGRWFAYTVWLTPYATHTCSAFLVASDPKDGDKSKQLTWQDTTGTYLAYPYQPPYTDYDPFWSPLGYEVAFDRDDWTIFRKGIPGVAGVPDTSFHLVTQTGYRGNGDLTPGISPDGLWVAFARRDFGDSTKPFNLWKVPIAGGTAKRLTRTTGVGITDFYPRWSPDGAWILFDRRFPADTITHHLETHGIFKVPADSGAVVQVYGPVEPPAGGDTLIAVTPAWSPDGLIVTGSIGKRVSTPASVLDCKTYTFDPSLSVSQMKPVLNYDDPRFTVNSDAVDVGPTPVLSADGTRLLLTTKQLWAVRRNMNSPPVITTVGGVAVADTAPSVSFLVSQCNDYLIDVVASDTEQDAITYQAYFLQSWMSFSPTLHRLTVAPGGTVGQTYNVVLQVTTSSGGTDRIIARFYVCPCGGCSLSPSAASDVDLEAIPGPNPTRGAFAVPTPFVRGTTAHLVLFDVSGRRVAQIHGPAGFSLVWDGKGRNGALVVPGIYLYRVQAGTYRREGKVVVIK